MSSDILYYQQQEQPLDTSLDFLLENIGILSNSITELLEKKESRSREKGDDIYEDVSGYYSLEVALQNAIGELHSKVLAFKRGYIKVLGTRQRRKLDRTIQALDTISDRVTVPIDSVRKNILILETILSIFRDTVSKLQAHATNEIERIMLSPIKPLYSSHDPITGIEE